LTRELLGRKQKHYMSMSRTKISSPIQHIFGQIYKT